MNDQFGPRGGKPRATGTKGTSRWRVDVHRTLADTKLDVEHAQRRLTLSSADNVFRAPIIGGIVFAVIATMFALGAALRVRFRAESEAQRPVPGAAAEPASASTTVEVDVER
jgi:hypothetical protein